MSGHKFFHELKPPPQNLEIGTEG